MLLHSAAIALCETMGGQSHQILPGFPTTAGADLPCKGNNTTSTSSPYVHRKTWRPIISPCNIPIGNKVKSIEMVSIAKQGIVRK